MKPTEIRRATEAAIDVPEDVKVLLAPTEYTTSFGDEVEEYMLFVRILVGTPSEDSEDRVDALVEEIPKLIARDRGLGEVVSDTSIVRCGGHQLFPDPPLPPQLGVQWTIKVLL